MVSSLFSIKAAHCGNAIEFAMDGEGKRQREAPPLWESARRQGLEIRGQRSAKKHGEVENPEAHNDTTKKAVGCLSNARA